jgi:hypothetical protein
MRRRVGSTPASFRRWVGRPHKRPASMMGLLQSAQRKVHCGRTGHANGSPCAVLCNHGFDDQVEAEVSTVSQGLDLAGAIPAPQDLVDLDWG